MGSPAARVDVGKRPFCKRLLSLSGRYTLWELWGDFITMFACAISNSVDKTHFKEREEMYMRIISKYSPEEQQVFPQLVVDITQALEENPDQDFLGSAYMELEMGNSQAGQFFTPYSLCAMMARLNNEDMAEQIKAKGYITVNDCACGAGATLVAAANSAREACEKMDPPRNWQNHVLIVAQDIDFIVGMMCYIQLSLIGAAGFVKIGNSLTDPMCEGDDKKNYWFTPMYYSPVWRGRRTAQALDRIFNPPKSTKTAVV